MKAEETPARCAALRLQALQLFSTPTNQPLRPYRGVRLRVAAFCCLSVLLSGAVVWAKRPVNPYSSNDTRSAQGKEITYRGCLWRSAHSEGWVLVGLEGGSNTAFELVGDTSKLEMYGDSTALTVQGIELSPPKSDNLGGELSGQLEVKRVEVLRPVAELDKSMTDASRWIRKRDQTYGLSFAVPKEASLEKGNSFTPTDLGPNSVEVFRAGFPIGPEDSHHSGHLSICVDTTASEKDTYSTGNPHPNHHPDPNQLPQSTAADQNFEWVNGIKYTRFVCGTGVRMADCSVSAFQNNLSYRFDFWFELGQPGMVEWGCLEPDINDQQERSFLRLFFSQVRFFRPEIPAADGRRVTTEPPQIIRFEKTALVRQNAYTLSLSLSWQARNADYVQLTYTCGPKVQIRTAQVYQASIEDPSFSRSCGDPELPEVVANRPPESSQKLMLYDQLQREPITLQITLTPCSHGDAFLQSSKSLSIDVPLR